MRPPPGSRTAKAPTSSPTTARTAAAAQRLADEFGGERIHLVGGDLTDPARTRLAWEQAVEAAGRIDVLVNNAGAWIASPLTDDGWADGWRDNLALNLQAPADLCRYAIEHFRTHGGGAIVNVASRSSHRGDDAEHLAYGAAKGGLLALTRGIARGYAHENILAYAVAPSVMVGLPDRGVIVGRSNGDLVPVAQGVIGRWIGDHNRTRHVVKFSADHSAGA